MHKKNAWKKRNDCEGHETDWLKCPRRRDTAWNVCGAILNRAHADEARNKMHTSRVVEKVAQSRACRNQSPTLPNLIKGESIISVLLRISTRQKALSDPLEVCSALRLSESVTDLWLRPVPDVETFSSRAVSSRKARIC